MAVVPFMASEPSSLEAGSLEVEAIVCVGVWVLGGGIKYSSHRNKSSFVTYL